jgi:ketosteroid isomerase-like protein
MPMYSAISGSQAFEAGTATVTVPAGRKESGKYLVVFRQVAGAWKIAYDIHNADHPSPASK